MGDGADMARSNAADYEELRLDYRLGAISDLDAFEMGLIDNEGYEPHSRRTSVTTCRCCGKSNLSWKQVAGKWRLFDGQQLHDCPVNPLPKTEPKRCEK